MTSTDAISRSCDSVTSAIKIAPVLYERLTGTVPMKFFPFFSTILVLSLATTFLFIYISINNDGTRERQRSRAKKVNVIIMSQPRSGSSFTGDIFNHHPDVFYLYEPLHNFNKTHSQLTKETYGKMVLNLLRDIFNCEITDHGLLFELVVRQKLMQWQNDLLAPAAENKSTHWNYKFIPALFGANVRKACKDRRITVVKILTPRLPSIAMENLVSLCKPDKFECFIIHLVRDPRAVMHSLEKLRFFSAKKITRDFIEQYAHKTCRQIEQNINYVQQLPVFFQNRVVRLYYENLVENPKDVVSNLFDLVGLRLVESAVEWLNKSTNPTQILAEQNLRNPYNTVKNSKQVVNKWRLEINSLLVQIVERVCGPLMDTLGYLKVDGSNRKLRDYRIRLFIRTNEKGIPR